MKTDIEEWELQIFRATAWGMDSPRKMQVSKSSPDTVEQKNSKVPYALALARKSFFIQSYSFP